MRRIVSSSNKEEIVTFGEADIPTIKENECLVRVTAFSLNLGEVRYASSNPPGSPMGWDIVGIIEETAKDGSGPAKGTRVVGFSTQGGWAEYITLPTNFLAPIPNSVSDAVAATLPVAGLTALYAVEKGSRFLGNRVLSTGVTGGVGFFAMQLAKLMGAESIAQVRKPGQVDFARSYGADDVIVTTTGEEAARLAPYRLLVDGVGGTLLGNLLKFVNQGGTVVSYGISDPSDIKITAYPGFGFIGDGGRAVYGFTLFAELNFESASSGLTRLLRLVEKGQLKSYIGREESWDKTSEVAQAFIKREFNGKAVLHIDF